MDNVALCYAYEYFMNQEKKNKMAIHFEMLPGMKMNFNKVNISDEWHI